MRGVMPVDMPGYETAGTGMVKCEMRPTVLPLEKAHSALPSFRFVPTLRRFPMTTTRSEFFATAKLALPIAIGLAGHGMMTTLDALFLGRHSTESLAACGVGTSAHLPLLIFGYGLVSGVSVLAAQGRGAGEHQAAGRALRAGLILSAGFGLLIALIIQGAVHAGILALLELPPGVEHEAAQFLIALGWSSPLSLVFQALKNHAEADHRPWRPMAWLIVGLATNAALCALLIFGFAGLPAMGALGAGLATIAGRAIMLVGLGWQERAALRLALHIDAHGGMRAILRFGVPCAVHWTAEVGVFAAAPLIIARYFGEEAVAANQIAISIAGLAFMLPMGISQAAGIRVGEAFGAKDWTRLRVIGRGALIFALSFMGIYAAVVSAANTRIPEWFLGHDDAPIVMALASKLLIVAAIFSLADGVQVTIAGLLRGLADTRYASIIGLVAYWVIGMPAGVFLAFTFSLEALGIWIGLAIGLFFAAFMFTRRWYRLLNRMETGGIA